MSNNRITVEFLNELLDLADKLEVHYDLFEGSLLDNYIFYGTEDIKISGEKKSKYIIVKEVFINTWTSGLELITTNDINIVNDFIDFLEQD